MYVYDCITEKTPFIVYENFKALEFCLFMDKGLHANILVNGTLVIISEFFKYSI